MNGMHSLAETRREDAPLIQAGQSAGRLASVAAFHDELRARFGPEAAYWRHEIYFLCVRRGGRLALRARAIAALLRDVVMLFLGGFGPRASKEARLLAIATLKGASGFGAVEAPLSIASQYGPTALICHPRVRGERLAAARVCFAEPLEIFKALRAGARLLTVDSPQIDKLIVATTVARGLVWKACWNRTLRRHHSPVLLLHNDFDMMSASAIGALDSSNSAICIQHGVPTDEFFPCNAGTQVVWGRACRRVYQDSGFTGRLIEDAVNHYRRVQNRRTADLQCVPTRLLLLSQTHTPIYGIELGPYFTGFAQALIARRVPLQVLLHPNEFKGSSMYGSGIEVCVPPHKDLVQAAPPALVLGYSSTALIDAALVGHYVVGVDWPVKTSIGAFHVSSPPLKVKDADEAAALFEKLRADEDARRQFVDRQNEWLSSTFTVSRDFEEIVKQLLDGVHAS